MPHAIFFMKDGHAIHGSYEVKTLGKPVSHGCVRISPKNAATLYALVKKNGMKNAQVVLTGVTPGGDSTWRRMNILVGLSPKTTTMRHPDVTAMRPLEDTMLLKGAAFSSNCSATDVVDFAAAIMPRPSRVTVKIRDCLDWLRWTQRRTSRC